MPLNTTAEANPDVSDDTSATTGKDRDEVVAEALGVIDKALSRMMSRELVGAGEITDLLLDVRQLIGPFAASASGGTEVVPATE